MVNQPNIPGQRRPFKRQPGVTGDQLIIQEPMPTHQPGLPEFIKFFTMELPQLISGALPSLFGSSAGTETVGGIKEQRDQALGRLGTPWHAIQEATASYTRQAVALAARCRKKNLDQMDHGKRLIVEVADLKGNVRCFADVDENFPETWEQRQGRLMMVWQDISNPMVAKLMKAPKNITELKDAVGLQDFEVPEADDIAKQEGELDILLSTGPAPNGAVLDIQDQIKALSAQPPTPESLQQIAQLTQQANALPQLVTTVPIDEDLDDNEVQAATCREFMMSSAGRKLLNSIKPEDRDKYANVRLHWKAHDDAAKKKAQEAAAAMAPPPKQPAESVNYKDLPPAGKIQLAEQSGIQLKPEDVNPAPIPTTALVA